MWLAANQHTTPEERLIASILIQAYHDLFTATTTGHDQTKLRVVEHDNAIAFLTAKSGKHAALRNHFCGLLGTDGDHLAEAIRAMMEGKREFLPPQGYTSDRNQKRFKEGVERVRRRYRELNARYAKAA